MSTKSINKEYSGGEGVTHAIEFKLDRGDDDGLGGGGKGPKLSLNLEDNEDLVLIVGVSGW